MSKPDINEFAFNLREQLNNYYITAQGCWIHRNKTNNKGYVILQYHTNSLHYQYLAHRVSYALFKGFVPKDVKVLHTCDIPNCVNPEHLFLGSVKDNAKDMSIKKRGKNQYGSQLTELELSAVAFYRGMGWSQRKVANLLGISQSTISLYECGKRVNSSDN